MVIFFQGCDAKSFTKRDENAIWHKENSANFSTLDEGNIGSFSGAGGDAPLKG